MGISGTALRTMGIAIALTCAASANATTFYVGDFYGTSYDAPVGTPGRQITPKNGYFFLTNGTTPFSPVITATFGSGFVATPANTVVDDSFVFTIPQDGLGSGNLSTSFSVTTNMLTISQVLFNDNDITALLSPGVGGQSLTVNDLVISALAQNTLRVVGSVIGTSGYSGNLTFNAAAVPEPATWAMMLVGFGAIGAASRRRRVRTSVSFS